MLSNQCNQTQLELNNVTKYFTDIANKYKEMCIQHEQLMQHYKSIEKRYRKYSNIIPDILYDDITFEELTSQPRDAATPTYEKRTLDIVNTLLYQRPEYCFTAIKRLKT